LSVLLKLKEDVEYSEEKFVGYLVKKGIDSFEARKVWGELFEFIDKDLSRFIRALRTSIYENLEVEAAPPSVNYAKQTIFTGEWIGVYRFYSSTLGHEVEIHITPKIKVRYFIRMLNDIFRLVDMLGYPAMKVIWLNTHGLSYVRDHVSYSGMLQQLTELLMAEGFPPIVSPREFICGDAIGHINRSKTLKFLVEGIPLVVAKRQEISYPRIPLMILAKFHATLENALLKLLNDIKSVENPALEPLKKMIYNMVKYHSYILTTDILGALVDTSYSIDLESPEILDKAREQAGKSKWLKDIIDLYQSYVYRKPLALDLFKKWQQNIPIQPLPSNKIYELWVLSLFLKIFINRLQTLPFIKEREAGFEFDFNIAEIQYNVARSDWSKVFSRITRPPRPDYILASERKRAVADAKYKEPRNLSAEDIERIIAYVVDYSEPQDSEEIKGFLITLGESDPDPIIARTDTTPKIKIYHLTADPRHKNLALAKVEEIYNKVFM
jgi:hypothetical protein